MTEISDRFPLAEVDHQELIEIFTLRYGTCWRVAERQIAFPAHRDHQLRLELRHGQIIRIWAGNSLSDQELDGLLDQIEADLKDKRIAEFGAEILFAHRPVQGGFRFKAIPMQILPPPSDAPLPQQWSADHPFVLEYPIQAFRSPELRLKRRQKNAVEWTWVLNALLRGSIKCSGTRPRQMWAIKSGDMTHPCFWAQEFYLIPGFVGFSGALSEAGSPLPVVPSDAYFDERRQLDLPIDTFFVHDNLDTLIGAFLQLDGDERRRFLRSAAAVYIAHELWEVSISSFLLGCVQAIETLIDRPTPTPCPTCNRDMGPGPTRLFRDFVETHCLSSGVDQKAASALYSVRSSLAHGSYLFQIDEAPWSMNLGAIVASDHEIDVAQSALLIAKEGLRNWLLAKSAEKRALGTLGERE
jgi:hypothetical protein